MDRKRVEEVLALAGLDADFAERGITLESYMTDRLTEDGIDLSGGQEQKFLIARALYKDAPALLLDEPTAALDPLAEHEVYESYQELCRDKTALFISHRLASTQFSDWIMFLQDGHITEMGSHEELLAAGGEYARLYELQAGTAASQLIPKEVWWTAVSLVLYLLIGKLSNESEVIKSHSWELLDARMAVKNMEMNYPDLDSPYTNKLYSRMEEDNRWGSGIYGGFDNLEKLCYQAFNAVFAVGMLVPVLYELFVHRNILTYLFFAVLVLAILCNAAAEWYFGRKMTEYIALWTDDKPDDTNLMWYYAVYDGISMENRKDVKLYDAIDLLKEYTFVHGMGFLKYKDDLVAGTGGRREFVINILNAGVRGICYLFLMMIALLSSVSGLFPV